jgi:PAS domain S-box-containing protein
VNKAYADVCGYPLEFFPGKNHFDLYPHEENEAIFRRVAETGTPFTIYAKPFEFPNHPEWGVTYWDWTLYPVKSVEGTIEGLLLVLLDVTRNKKAEDVLKESEERYRRITEAIADYIYTVTVKNGSLVETRHSEACIAVTGYTSREFAENPYLWIRMVPEEDRNLVRGQAEEVLSGQVPKPIEHRVIRKNGDLRWVESSIVPLNDINGNLISYDGVVHDITERKQAEKAFLASEMRYRNLLENIQLLAVMLDLDGNIVFCNNYLLRLTGWAKDEALNKNWFDFFLPENVRDTVKSVFKAVINEGTMLHYENPVITRDGVLRHIVWDNAILLNSEGNVIGTASIGIDVTDHRKLEEQFRQAQKMEAIGLLAGGVAHDFNNVLTAIVGYAHITLMKMKNADPLRKNLEQILAASDKATTLTQSLLSFSRKQLIVPRPVNVNNIVSGIKMMLDTIIGEDIELKVNTADKELIVLVDKNQIEHVLINLATNALDAMPDGGTLTIITEEVEIDEEFVQMHQYGIAGRYAVITVTDTGVGMDEKTKENIFEPFFTTKEVDKGTGLGLAMVYGTIKQHEGFINVYSEPGKGTTFRIYLPLSGSGFELTEEKASSPVPSGNETILLVEDNMSARIAIKSILEDFGYKVLEAVDGEDGLSMFTEHRERIQLIISDVIMPKKHGREMYEETKKVTPGIKIIFISGYPGEIIDKKSLLEKEMHFINKPVKPDELLRKIREVLDN